MVENSIVGLNKVQDSFYAELHVATSVFPLVDYLALWNKIKVNNNLDIEQSDSHMQVRSEPFI